jgi:hypothetical protein
MARRPMRRPLEILNLIRDGVIRDFKGLLLVSGSHNHSFIGEFERGLIQLGIIERDKEGNLKTTARLEDLCSALKLSLTQLSPYDENSVVCSPTFGLPETPPVAGLFNAESAG